MDRIDQLLIGTNPMLGVPIALGKTMANRITRPGVSIIKAYGSDNLIDSIFDSHVFGNWIEGKDKERLLKDALALSQDVYVVNGHSTNFYHTSSYSSLHRGWFLLNSKLDLDFFPDSIRFFCNEIKSVVPEFNNTNNGFGSMLCVCEFFNDVFLVAYIFEGTNPIIDWKLDFKDILTDIKQGLNGKDTQYIQAIRNAKKIVESLKNRCKLYFFGHSLGGGLANAAALATGFPAITFNAASLHPDYVSQYQNNYKKHLLASVYVEHEMLSTPLSNGAGLPKAGDRYKIRLSQKGSALDKHKLEPLCAKYNLEKNTWNKTNEI